MLNYHHWNALEWLLYEMFRTVHTADTPASQTDLQVLAKIMNTWTVLLSLASWEGHPRSAVCIEAPWYHMTSVMVSSLPNSCLNAIPVTFQHEQFSSSSSLRLMFWWQKFYIRNGNRGMDYKNGNKIRKTRDIPGGPKNGDTLHFPKYLKKLPKIFTSRPVYTEYVYSHQV